MRISANELATKERATARQSSQDARAKRRALEDVTSHWPAAVKVSRVHAHKLYGAVASVLIGSDRADYYHDDHADDRCTLGEVADLLDQLPPLPMAIYKDGCTSFRPLLDESDLDRDIGNERTCDNDIFPAILEIEPNQDGYRGGQQVTWFTRLPGGPVVEVNAALRPDALPVSVRVNARRDKRTGKILEILETTLESVAPFWLEQRIKWGSGGSEYANKFTLYWRSVDYSLGIGKTWRETICGLY